jgi:hypothetical protein
MIVSHEPNFGEFHIKIQISLPSDKNSVPPKINVKYINRPFLKDYK